jgi:hypothetical protein
MNKVKKSALWLQWIPVYLPTGERLGQVPANATSIAASKLANAPCEFTRRFGFWAWVAK